MLIKLLALNNFKNIQISSNGLGDKADSVKLYKVCESNSGMNRILKATNTEFPYHEINIVKLDDEVNNYKLTRVDLIKIDVEGYELNVLKGALLTIQKYKPILFIELDDNNLKEQGTSAFELINFIKSLGYQIRQAESNQLLVETDTYTDCHYDILCQYI